LCTAMTLDWNTCASSWGCCADPCAKDRQYEYTLPLASLSMGRRKVLAANWKGSPQTVQEAEELAEAVEQTAKGDVEVVVFPAAVHLVPVGQVLQQAALGAQNAYRSGPVTGENSLDQLKACGVSWVMVGHSDRRRTFEESEFLLHERVVTALAAGFSVIYCIGEALHERKEGRQEAVWEEQLQLLPAVKDWDRFVVAYEPAWAIGTGLVATPRQAQEACRAVRSIVRSMVSEFAADSIRIQYTGSVTAKNCEELVTLPDVDGFVVGSASLKAQEFAEIIRAVAQAP